MSLIAKWSAARAAAIVIPLVAAMATSGCAGSKRAQRLQRAEIQKRLGALEKPGLLIGEFPLESILDGDTVRVVGLDSSLRLHGLDTEETFKTEGDRRLFEGGWEEYLKEKRGNSKHPVKMATPLGEEAKKFAKHFFEDSPTVRLERDDPMELRDRYGRYLAYVFAKKNNEWVNYDIECVRAGMSPYFMKYGYSKRFHREFVQAEREAREAQLGIWSPDGMHYPDYPERHRWWTARAEFIKQIEDANEGRKDFIVLTHWDSLLRLEKFEGREVTLLGLVSDVRLGDRGPAVAKLGRSGKGNDFALVFFDKDVFGSSQVAQYKGEPVQVKGTVTRYRPRGRDSELQMAVKLPGQIVGRRMEGAAPIIPDDEDDVPRASVQSPEKGRDAAPPP